MAWQIDAPGTRRSSEEQDQTVFVCHLQELKGLKCAKEAHSGRDDWSGRQNRAPRYMANLSERQGRHGMRDETERNSFGRRTYVCSHRMGASEQPASVVCSLCLSSTVVRLMESTGARMLVRWKSEISTGTMRSSPLETQAPATRKLRWPCCHLNDRTTLHKGRYR
jgi:hypothetical protein